MFHLYAQEAAVPVDPLEPVRNAGEEGDIPSAVVQALPGQWEAPFLRFPEHGIHVSQNAVHLLPSAEVVGDLPEVPRGQSQGRDKCVVLHILSAEGFVEVIEKGYDRLVGHYGPPFFSAALRAARQPFLIDPPGLAQPRTLGSLLPRGKSDQKRAQGGGDSPLRIPLLICLVYARGTVCPA